eukprot:582173_1
MSSRYQPQQRNKRKRLSNQMVGVFGDNEPQNVNLNGELSNFYHGLPQKDQNGNPLNESMNKQLHALFKESATALKKLIQRTFKIRIALHKKTQEMEMLIKNDPSAYSNLTNYTKINSSIIPHPLVWEQYCKNMLTLEHAVNYIRITQYIKALNSALKLTNLDIQSIIVKVKKNYNAFMVAMIGARSEYAGWIPESMKQDVIPLQNNSDEQCTLLLNILHRFSMRLEVRFSELTIQKHLILDVSQKWLFATNENQRKTLMNKIKNNDNFKKEFVTRN